MLSMTPKMPTMTAPNKKGAATLSSPLLSAYAGTLIDSTSFFNSFLLNTTGTG